MSEPSERAVAWIARRPAREVRLVAFAIATLLAIAALRHSTASIDGTRYFWLADDPMVSMRYARNLVEGHGLVWNPGERVEGYTNLAWTLVMALVHATGIGDAKAALAIDGLGLGLHLAVIVLAERLLRRLTPSPGLALPAALVASACAVDVYAWSVKGFETTLLTAVFLLAIVRILDERGRIRAPTVALLGVVLLVRSDAFHVWFAAALLAFGLSEERRSTALRLLASLAPLALHVAFRRAYYGAWLPNTYYLKVYAVPGLLEQGVPYLARFVLPYGGAIAVGAWAARLGRDRVRALLLAGLVPTALYAASVGGDLFPHARHFAHAVPVVIVVAAASALDVAERRGISPLFPLALALGPVFAETAVEGLGHIDDVRGYVVAGVLVGRHTRPDAVLGVFTAGNAPYFARRRSLDLLGKCDLHVARLPGHRGALPGLAKFDYAYSLGLAPEVLFVVAPHEAVLAPDLHGQAPDSSYAAALANDPTFRNDYYENPVPLPYLLEGFPIYVNARSPELASIATWVAPHIE